MTDHTPKLIRATSGPDSVETAMISRPVVKFDEARKILDCTLVQWVPLYCFDDGGWSLLIDEEGKLKPHRLNLVATRIALNDIGASDYIAGDAILIRVSDLDKG